MTNSLLQTLVIMEFALIHSHEWPRALSLRPLAVKETLVQEKIMTESAVVNGYIREAVEQNELKNARKYLIELLRRKFKASLNDQTIEAINNQPILDILDDWRNKAWDANTWNQFVKSLRQTT